MSRFTPNRLQDLQRRNEDRANARDGATPRRATTPRRVNIDIPEPPNLGRTPPILSPTFRWPAAIVDNDVRFEDVGVTALTDWARRMDETIVRTETRTGVRSNQADFYNRYVGQVGGIMITTVPAL